MVICVVVLVVLCYFFFFFKQKTAYEMRISDWSSDVCSSDLAKGVVCAFRAFRERSHATLELDRVNLVAAAGEYLVRIALVAHIPHQPVVGGDRKSVV